jgi:threonine dehydratase
MEPLPNRAEIEAAASIVNEIIPPSWPLLNARLGCEAWIKHENHTPIGAFKIRGGVYYIARLVQREPTVRGVTLATRGNHGQAIAFAAKRLNLKATIVVPRKNSGEKNNAMRALGAELIEYGEDFQEALEHSKDLADQKQFHWVPSFHRDLVCGNAVSALNFLQNAPPLARVYVPIGLGSGICAMLAARDALGLACEIIGVGSESAPAISLSFAARRLTSHPVSTRIADGLACSTPNREALEYILSGVNKVVSVSDDETESAMRCYFTDTHNVAEGAAGTALAAALKDKENAVGNRIGIVLTGGNVDATTFARVLSTELT